MESNWKSVHIMLNSIINYSFRNFTGLMLRCNIIIANLHMITKLNGYGITLWLLGLG